MYDINERLKKFSIQFITKMVWLILKKKLYIKQ